MEKKEPLRIDSVLEEVSRGLGLGGCYEGAKVTSCWKKAVGERVAESTKPWFLRERVLFVMAKNSLWAQELSFMKKELLKRLNTALGKNAVKDIRFKVGKWEEESRPPLFLDVPLTAGEKRGIERLLEPVKEKKIRERLERVLVLDFKLRKIRSEGETYNK